ncbi:MAG: TraR/DksA family transcriptional regulator [Planctomycetes bacterium]|nr:TraR/DksA family transcriptional regulator [Planctomycetota bacterium]
MRATELARFKKALLERRQELAGDVTRMGDEAMRKSRQSASGDLSSMPYHMADIGTDNYDQEFTLGMIENEEDEVRAIDDALEKIENGGYGVCETCGCKIKKPRLKFMPYARNCIDCQQKEEQQSRPRR